MLCKQCGAEIPEDAVLCEACMTKENAEPEVQEAAAPAEVPAEVPAEKPKAPKKAKKGPGFFLGLLSFILCLALMVSIVASVAILDVRMLTSKDNMGKIVSGLLSAPARPAFPMIQTGAVRVHGSPVRYDETDAMSGLTDGSNSALIDFVLDQLEGQFGQELEVDKEAVENFLEKSTAKDFISEKMSGYMEDFINGTSNTTITTEEIKELVEENKDLIESEFGVEVTDEVVDTVVDFVEESKINEVVHEEIIENVSKMDISQMMPGLPNFKPLPGMPGGSGGGTDSDSGYTIADLLTELRAATSETMLAAAIGVCVLIMVLLFFTRGMRIDKCLRTSSVPTIIVGVLLAIPVAAIQFGGPALASSIPDLALIVNVVNIVIAVIAPVHYGVLGIGFAFLIVGSIIGAFLKPKKVKAAA